MDNHKHKEQLNREYIANEVNPIVEKLILDLLKEKPSNTVEKYLNIEGGNILTVFKTFP